MRLETEQRQPRRLETVQRRPARRWRQLDLRLLDLRLPGWPAAVLPLVAAAAWSAWAVQRSAEAGRPKCRRQRPARARRTRGPGADAWSAVAYGRETRAEDDAAWKEASAAIDVPRWTDRLRLRRKISTGDSLADWHSARAFVLRSWADPAISPSNSLRASCSVRPLRPARCPDTSRRCPTTYTLCSCNRLIVRPTLPSQSSRPPTTSRSGRGWRVHFTCCSVR